MIRSWFELEWAIILMAIYIYGETVILILLSLLIMVLDRYWLLHCLVLVQPRKTRPDITEKLLTGM